MGGWSVSYKLKISFVSLTAPRLWGFGLDLEGGFPDRAFPAKSRETILHCLAARAPPVRASAAARPSLSRCAQASWLWADTFRRFCCSWCAWSGICAHPRGEVGGGGTSEGVPKVPVWSSAQEAVCSRGLRRDLALWEESPGKRTRRRLGR